MRRKLFILLAIILATGFLFMTRALATQAASKSKSPQVKSQDDESTDDDSSDDDSSDDEDTGDDDSSDDEDQNSDDETTDEETDDEETDSTTATLTSISPTNGPAGTEVTLKGANLGDDCSETETCTMSVSFGSSAISRDSGDFVSWSNEAIVVKVPKGSVTGGTKVVYASADTTYTLTGPTFTVNKKTVSNSDPLTYVIGADKDEKPTVKVMTRAKKVKYKFLAYDESFQGGVRVDMGDVNADGILDIVTVPGAGSKSTVKVFDGKTGKLFQTGTKTFMAYDSKDTQGMYVAVGDVNGDGYADIITGLDQGGKPQVRVFSGKTGKIMRKIVAYSPTMKGGVRVAAGDVNGDGKTDIITAPGKNSAPYIKVFSGANGKLITTFLAYAQNVKKGVFVASGDVNADGYKEIITGFDEGKNMKVKVWSGKTKKLLGSVAPYGAKYQGGVRVGVVDRNGDGKVEMITSTTKGTKEKVKIWNGKTLKNLDSFFAFDKNFDKGTFVGGGR